MLSIFAIFAENGKKCMKIVDEKVENINNKQ
jgi:hypothetical protein